MNLWQPLVEALESLAANKMRSILTVLGIVIGVAAVIAMISIGRGAESTITGSIQGIGTNLIFVFRGGSEDVRNPQPITTGDAEAIGDPFQAPRWKWLHRFCRVVASIRLVERPRIQRLKQLHLPMVRCAITQ